MEYYLELSMVNFRCWERKTFKFNQGITLLSAASGKGKSTICEAIYWALYGTLKNVSSKDYVKKETIVTLILYSNNLKCKITRIRPQNLTVELLINNEIKVLQKHDGQNWINDIFGSANVFIASSYLSQGTRHFLMTSSSSERMNLLKEITFGDDSEKNSPDYYLNKLKGEINSLSLLINSKCNSKSSCQEIINQFYQKNKDYLIYGLIDKNTNINNLKIKEDILKNIDIYTKLYYQNQQSKIILNKINSLNYIEFNQYQLLEDYKNFLEYDSLLKELSFFNEKVLTIDNDILINDKYLYSKYFSVGYNEKEDITIFLNNKKIHYKKYDTYISILKENEIISKTNKREEQIYNENLSKYTKQLNEYNNYISSSKLYKELEEDLLSFLSNNFNGKKIEDITYPSLEKDQYLYSQYIKHGYDINSDILLFIENVKEQHNNYKIFLENEQKNRDISSENNKNREINQIREKQYNEELKKYNNYLIELEKYNIIQEDLLSFLSNNFNGKKIEDITYPSLEKDQYLYSQYIKHGYDINSDILLFIENVKEQHNNYKIFLENEQKNRDISSENNKNREINQIREKQYNEELKKYNNYLIELEKYNIIQEDLLSFLSNNFNGKKIEDITYPSLEKDQYLYSQYIKHGYDINSDILLFIENVKEQHNNYKIFLENEQKNRDISSENNKNREINQIREKQYNEELKKYNNYLIELEKYNIIQEDLLSFLSNNFNGKKIEDITYPSLEKDQYLYSQYIKHGYDINSDILLFIENVKEQHNNYKIFLENEQKNRDISSENNKNREINQIREKQYNEELKKYNNYLIELEKYNIEINKIEVCNKINDDDDLSIGFLRNLIEKSTNLLCDLYCPHCNKGLFLQDNKLNKGSISIDEKDNILLILIDAKRELNKRIKNEKLEKTYKPKNVEIPNKIESMKILPLIDNKHIDKPNFSLFEMPILSFQEINNIILLKEKYSKTLYKPKNIELPNIIILNKILPLIDNKHVDKPILNIFEIPILSFREISNIIILKEKYSKIYKPTNVELPNTIILNKILPLITNKHINKPILSFFEIPILSFQDISNIILLKEKYSKTLYKPKNIELPDKIESIKILPLIQNKHVDKPILNIFEIPILSFQDINNIILLKEKYSKLSKIIRYNIVDKPNNINEFIPLNLKPFVKIDKYDLDIFEIPLLSYEDICSIEKSKSYIQKYHIMKKYNGKIYNNAKEYYNQLVNEKYIYEKKKIEYDLLNKQLSELPEIIDNIEDYINKLNNDLKLISHRIESFQFANDYNNLIISFNNIENDIMTMVNKNNNLNKIYKTISELSSKYLEEIIDDINSSLKLILDELFDKSIDVKLSTHKILKNGTEKLDINLEVFFGDMNYDNLNFLSGGEKDRISLALLLSFSKMKNQNIIILDEVCASLNDELRDKVLDIINEWNKDKIIINICHGISKGMHENIINI